MTKIKKLQEQPILQIVSMPRMNRKKKANGEVSQDKTLRPASRGEQAQGKNGRSFETRFIPRYKKMPETPRDLETPTFSESSNKILKERYLLKGGNLETVESVTDRFWHIACDIASGDFDFGASEKQVLDLARSFYSTMVRQEFLPNSPTIMNAGKQNGLQYSACFVLPVGDSLPEIFDAIKYAALIHQTGGGCISADARVWTTFCGIEPIEVLVSRAISDGRFGVKQGQGTAYDVSDLNIKTVSMNPKSGEMALKNVTHVWQFDVPKDQQILVTTYQGTKVQTSLWHPFMVVRGTKLLETRADQLINGDIILGPDQVSAYWPWRKEQAISSFTIDEELGWLIGFTLGDGSFGYVPSLRQYRVRWFSGTEDVLKKVQSILIKYGIKVSIQKDKRGLLSITTLNQRFVYDLIESCGLEKFGPKDNVIKVPEIIAKSPLPVVWAFLAGLLDSDGYVAPDGSPSYSTISETMAQDLAALVSLLGFHPTLASKEPYGKGKHKVYSVQLCTLPQVNKLADKLNPYISNSLRLSRLKSDSRKQTALPLEFRPWRDFLFTVGLVHKRSNNVGAGPLYKELNYWSAHGRIDRDSILAIADKVQSIDKQTALLLRRIADSGQEIKEVKKAPTPKRFYDLSVADWNTYAAGQSGMVMIHNTGFSFSRLRPSGSVVKTTGGVASGPVSFLRVFNAATESIKQGGTRRGANMGILRIDHPDILEFIRCKASLDEYNQSFYDAVEPYIADDVKESFKRELLDKQIANFNISCAVTDKFMQSFAKGKDYDLIDPRTKKAVGKLNAKEVFDEIIERAWSTGDPGVVFIDRINHSPANPVPELEEIEATNPCVTGDTLVATLDGWRRADEIKIGDQIGTVLGSGLVERMEVYNKKPVFRVKLSDGAELKVTAAHQFHAIKHKDRAKNAANKHFSQLKLSELEVGDMVRVFSAPMPDKSVADLPDQWKERDYGFFVGMLLGDGCITEKSLTRNVVKIAVNTDETEWVAKVKEVLYKTGSKVVSLDSSGGRSANLTVQSSTGAALMIRQSLLTPSYSYEKHIPIGYQNTNRQFLAGLIDGLFSTDGNVNLTSTHPALRFKTTSKQLAQDIRRILLCFGIHGRITAINKVKDGHIGARTISSKHQQYEVIISGAGVKIFAEQIGLSHPEKQKRLQKARLEYALTGNTWLAQIVSIEPAGLEKVYDLYEPISDTWITEGIVSRGCGEQPLGAFDACNLGSINLGKFVLEDGSDVDWEGLRGVIQQAVLFLDNVVQVNPYTLPQIYEEVHKNRRIGLGVMGWADMLFKLKIPYNSDQAIELGEKVMKFINEEGHKKSEQLAQLRGPFPSFPHSIYKNSKPLRNSTVSTIAPTGTISIIGDCSSGIEPVFAVAYIHQVKRPGIPTRILTIANKTFEEIAKRENFYSEDLAQKVMEKGTVRGMDDVPKEWQEVFITAPEIDPETHVKMQAAFQKYTDNGVSKTINLPNWATREDVAKAYLLAWETGCTGITVYRDGSKSSQVLNISSTLSPKTEKIAALGDRPVTLRGRTYKMSTPVGEAFITINRDSNDQPFEVFVTIGKAGMHTAADAEAIGRLVSLALRVSRPNSSEIAKKIAAQLRGIGGAHQIGFGKDRVMSLADAIAKALSEDLAVLESSQTVVEPIPLDLTSDNGQVNGQSNGEVSAGYKPTISLSGVDLCPECGQASLVLEEGCQKCHSCGYSMC